MKKSTRATVIEVLIAFIAVTLFVSIIRATEPPQCNLPGWGVVKQSLTARAAVRFEHPGKQYTHTCDNADCPFAKATGWRKTWTPSQIKSHNCPYCDVEQKVVDTPSRMTTVLIDESAVQPKGVIGGITNTYTAPIFAIPGLSSGGCASGQCSAITNSRFKFLR